MTRGSVIIALLAGALCSSASYADSVDHIPASSSLVVALEVKTLLSKPAIQQQLIPPLRGLLNKYPAIPLMLTALKLDPFKDVDSLIVTAADLTKSQGLAILTGSFSIKRIQAAALAAAALKKDQIKIHKLKDTAIYEMTSAGLSVYSSVVSESTILLSISKPYLAAVLQQKVVKKPRLLASALTLAQKSQQVPDGWALGLQSAQLKKWLSLTPLARGVGQIRAITGRTVVGDKTVTISSEIHAKTPQTAQALAQMVNQVRLVLLLAKLSPVGRAAIDDVLKSLRVARLRAMATTQFQIRISSLASLVKELQQR